jgi:hypothetical protein
MTHDCKRHGTTTLFAALNILDGSVIGCCQPRHSNEEWLKFLRRIDREAPKDQELHLICDNYGTHKQPSAIAWLERHPRFHIHFAPTSASWLNMVERFVRDLTVDRLRQGVFRSVSELIAAIKHYVATHNDNQKSSSGSPRPVTSCRKSSAQTSTQVPKRTKHYTSGTLRACGHASRATRSKETTMLICIDGRPGGWP